MHVTSTSNIGWTYLTFVSNATGKRPPERRNDNNKNNNNNKEKTKKKRGFVVCNPVHNSAAAAVAVPIVEMTAASKPQQIDEDVG